MRKIYLLLFSLIITTCFYGQKKDIPENSQLNQNNSLTKAQEIKDFKIYPNPVTNGKLFINTFSNSDKTIQIFDILGKQVVSANIKGREMNISKLHPGVYILKVFEEGKTATRKLVIK